MFGTLVTYVSTSVVPILAWPLGAFKTIIHHAKQKMVKAARSAYSQVVSAVRKSIAKMVPELHRRVAMNLAMMRLKRGPGVIVLNADTEKPLKLSRMMKNRAVARKAITKCTRKFETQALQAELQYLKAKAKCNDKQKAILEKLVGQHVLPDEGQIQSPQQLPAPQNSQANIHDIQVERNNSKVQLKKAFVEALQASVQMRALKICHIIMKKNENKINNHLDPEVWIKNLLDDASKALENEQKRNIFDSAMASESSPGSVEGKFIKLYPNDGSSDGLHKPAGRYFSMCGKYVLVRIRARLKGSEVASMSYAWGSEKTRRTVLDFIGGPRWNLGAMWNEEAVLFVLLVISQFRWIWIDQFCQDQDADLLDKLVDHLPQYYKLTTVVMLLPTLTCRKMPVVKSFPGADKNALLQQDTDLMSHVSTCKCGIHLRYCLKRMWTWQEFTMSSALMTLPCLGAKSYNVETPCTEIDLNVLRYFQSVERWGVPLVNCWRMRLSENPRWKKSVRPLLQVYLTMNVVVKKFHKLPQNSLKPFLTQVAKLQLVAEKPQDLLFATFALIDGIKLPGYRNYDIPFEQLFARAAVKIAKVMHGGAPICGYMKFPDLKSLDSSCLQHLVTCVSAPINDRGLSRARPVSVVKLIKDASLSQFSDQFFEWVPPREWTLSIPVKTPGKELIFASTVLKMCAYSREGGMMIQLSRAYADSVKSGFDPKLMLKYLVLLMFGYTPNHYPNLEGYAPRFLMPCSPAKTTYVVPCLLHFSQSHNKYFQLWVSGSSVLVSTVGSNLIVGFASFRGNFFQQCQQGEKYIELLPQILTLKENFLRRRLEN